MKQNPILECKLSFSKKSKPTEEDVIFYQKDLTSIYKGCLLEIFNQIHEKHYLIKVESINTNNQQKDNLTIDQTFATSMGLPLTKCIKLRIIDSEQITLDVLDLIIKDQYFSRSDMFRFSENIRSLAVFDGRKLKYSSFRTTVGDLWCRGKRITAGYVGKETRVIYRSKSAVVHIFIQMSHEMMEFDNFGDNYFEKAINFISDLFNKYNEHNCGHDVTIVLFSRIYIYSIPPNCPVNNIKRDYKNRCYEDFFCVVVQNERYMISEWRKVIKALRLRFNNFKANLEEFVYENYGKNVSMELSSAEDSNFLETLNMTLNLYENYYVDRNFDRTGKICVVITAGSGVFNVDRGHTHLTKQRICDLGIGIDLVCIGEQPLHAVPLFIFHNKEVHQSEATNDYCIPYWINHSFYRSQNEMQAIKMGKFIPRIKIKIEEKPKEDRSNKTYYENHLTPKDEEYLLSRIILDASPTDNGSQMSTSNSRDKIVNQSSYHDGVSSKDDSYIKSTKSNNRKITMDKKSTKRKALINPFLSNQLNIRATTNSRRWSHVFPIDKFNNPIQIHHKLGIDFPSITSYHNRKPQNMRQAWQKYYSKFKEDNPGFFISKQLYQFTLDSSSKENNKTHTLPISMFGMNDSVNTGIENEHSVAGDTSSSSRLSPLPSSFPNVNNQQRSIPHTNSMKDSLSNKKSMLSSDEQKWNWDNPKPDDSPINHMGVDWKSLTMPALLPITSDYYPDAATLEKQFMENNYQLMSQNFESNENITNTAFLSTQRKPLSIDDVFYEMINLRLNQGFQLVVNPPLFPQVTTTSSSKDNVRKYTNKMPNKNLYRLCIGRMYHCLEKQQDMIVVTQFMQKHLDSKKKNEYNYCMKMPDSIDYMRFRTHFTLQNNSMWNYYDNYILTYGSSIESDNSNEFKLQSCYRFWRCRFLLIPTHSSTKLIMEDKTDKPRCDIYKDKGFIDHNLMVEEFFRFMEVVNKFRRRVNSKTKKSATIINEQMVALGHQNIPKAKSVSSQLLDLKKSIQSACVLPLHLPTQQPTQKHQRHSLVNDMISCTNAGRHHFSSSNSSIQNPQHKLSMITYNDTCTSSQQSINGSNPVTPNEKLPKQFTFDGTESNLQTSLCESKEKLTDEASVDKILKAMEDRDFGVNFLPPADIVKYPVFTSYECIHWCIKSIGGINNTNESVKFLQKFINGKDFVSLTNSSLSRLTYGFVLYMLNPKNDKRSGSVSLENLTADTVGTSDPSHKSNRGIFEFAEVLLGVIEIDNQSETDFINKLKKTLQTKLLTPDGILTAKDIMKFEFLLPKLTNRVLTNVLTDENFFKVTGKYPEDDNMVYENGVIYKKVVLDIENVEEGRTEWGVFQHQATYHPSYAFEFMFQWLVATGMKLAEKINQWTRKLTHLQLIPVPSDPFALPSSFNSDPLRGPIFVPLRLSSIIDYTTENISINDIINKLFKDFPLHERSYRLLLMLEVILKRFGFVADNCVEYSTVDYDRYLANQNQVNDQGNDHSINTPYVDRLRRHQWTYVHCSGGMFAMLPRFCDHNECNPKLARSNSDSDNRDPLWIAPEIGFLWSWNKMLPKKLPPSTSLADEAFQDNMLADFRAFCANSDNRLVEFYEEMKQMMLTYIGSSCTESMEEMSSESGMTPQSFVKFQISVDEENIENINYENDLCSN